MREIRFYKGARVRIKNGEKEGTVGIVVDSGHVDFDGWPRIMVRLLHIAGVKYIFYEVWQLEIVDNGLEQIKKRHDI